MNNLIEKITESENSGLVFHLPLRYSCFVKERQRMDTKSLKYFLAVAEHRNFTKASEQLYITQSALSHHIAELESELSTKLFIRTTRSVNLSPSGEILYRSARDLISRFDQLATEIHKVDSGASGELVIGHLFSPFKDFLPEFTRYFQTEYPDVEIRFVRKNMGPLFETFSRGEIDVLFTMSFDIKEMQGVEWKPLFPDGMSLVVRFDHPLANVKTIDYAMLRDEPFITLEEVETPRFYPLLIQVCAARGFVPNIVSTPTTVEGVLMAVKAGFGIAIMPTSIGSYFVHDLQFIEMEGEDIKFSDAVAWRKGNDNPAVPLFLSALDRFLADSAL